MSIEGFVEGRRGDWEALAALLDRMGRRGPSRLGRQELLDLGRLYRQATSDLAQARDRLQDPELTAYLNDLVARAHGQIYRAEGGRWRDAAAFLASGFPLAVRSNLIPIGIAMGIFAAAALWAYGATILDPRFPDLLLPPELRDSLERRQLWVGSITGIKPLASSWIMTNNISVTFATFAGGILLGLGPVYLMAYNGILLGAIAGLVAQYGLSLEFWAFVLPHGVIELSAIFIAGGAGLLLGKGLLLPGDLSRRDALVENGRIAIQLILGCIPLLVVAGIIEGFFSPSALPPGIKIPAALALLALLVAYIFRPGTQRLA